MNEWMSEWKKPLLRTTMLSELLTMLAHYPFWVIPDWGTIMFTVWQCFWLEKWQTVAKTHLNRTFYGSTFFFFFFLPLRLHSLPVTLPKEEKNNHQWQLAVAKATPKASFTLKREHCTSSAWFWVLYTFGETSLVMNYSNDPWKYSLRIYQSQTRKKEKLPGFTTLVFPRATVLCRTHCQGHSHSSRVVGVFYFLELIFISCLKWPRYSSKGLSKLFYLIFCFNINFAPAYVVRTLTIPIV